MPPMLRHALVVIGVLALNVVAHALSSSMPATRESAGGLAAGIAGTIGTAYFAGLRQER